MNPKRGASREGPTPPTRIVVGAGAFGSSFAFVLLPGLTSEIVLRPWRCSSTWNVGWLGSRT